MSDSVSKLEHLPHGATVTNIEDAIRWRALGKDWYRRMRIRVRKMMREPWTYTPNDITHKKAHHKITLGGGTSGRKA